MDKIMKRIQNIKPLVIAVVFFLLFLLFGGVAAKISESTSSKDMETINQFYLSQIQTISIPTFELFWYILISNVKKAMIFFLLSFTILALPNMIFHIAKLGFGLGFLFMLFYTQYHFQGMLIFLVYLFPHGLIYTPMLLLCLKIGYEITSQRTQYLRLHNNTMLPKIAKYFILIFIGIMAGAFVESFFGASLLKQVIEFVASST